MADETSEVAEVDSAEQANRAGMDPNRLMVIGYLVFGIVVALVLGKVLELLFAQLSIANNPMISAVPSNPSTIIGMLLAVGGAIYCWKNQKIHDVSLAVASELMQVTWPSGEEVRISTIAVVAASLIAAGLLFAMDTLSYKIIVEWLPVLFRGGNS